MKRLTLSDHTADQTRHGQQQRQDDYALRMNAYESATESKRAMIEAAKSSAMVAWGDRRLLASSGYWLQSIWRSLWGWPKKPYMHAPSEAERIWTVGGEGEERVASLMAQQLGDDWTLVSGYRNALGEIDQILVGPQGLFTVEIKTVNGVVNIEGDHWLLDKYDKYGNLKERGRAIADRGGRSPSRQLNEPTDRLVQFLGKTLPTIRACRVVILAHARSRLARVSNPTVMPVVLSQLSLAELFRNYGSPLTTQDQSQAIELIQRDHVHNQRQRDNRRKSVDTKPPPLPR